MNVYMMVVLIVIVSAAAKILSKYFETTAARTKSGATENDVRGLYDEVERLRDRVHVLERIITEEDRDLKNDFRGLA